MNMRLRIFKWLLASAMACMIFIVEPISSYSEPPIQSAVHGNMVAGGVSSQLELNIFGRYLDPAQMSTTKIDAFKSGILEIVLKGYSDTGQFGQALRLCRVKEALAENESQRAGAHHCKLSALASLGRFSEIEELLLPDVSPVATSVSSSPLLEIARWQLIGKLSLHQGEISAGIQAYRTVLDLLGTLAEQPTMLAKLFVEVENKELLSNLQEIAKRAMRESRIDALNTLARIAYFRQDRDEYLKRINTLLEVAVANDSVDDYGEVAMDLAPSVAQMGEKNLAAKLAQAAHEIVKAHAGFREQPEPLVSFSVPEVIARGVGDERTTPLHVRSRLKLARSYMLLGRVEEATRLLTATLNLAKRYILEEGISSTLVAEVEETQADLMCQTGHHATALHSLRSARKRRQLATQTERSSSLGRRHLEFDSSLLAVNARLLAKIAAATPMPITKLEAINEVFSILAEFSSSRVDQSLRQASRVSLEQNNELKKLLRQEGVLVDHLIDLRASLSANVSQVNRLSDSDVTQNQEDLKRLLQAIRRIKKNISSVSREKSLSSVAPDWKDIRGDLNSTEIYWQWILHPEGNVVVAVTQQGVYVQPISSSMQKNRIWVKDLLESTHLQDGTKVSQLKEYPVMSANALFNALFPNFSSKNYKHWILSPPPPLDGTPWAALVTRSNSDAAQINDSQENGWLIEDVALTVVPSLETWVGLKRRSESRGSRAFLGFGNPENEEVIGSAEIKLKGSVVAAITPVASIKYKRNEAFSSELRAVSDIFSDTNKTVLAGPHATKKELLAQPLQEYRAILFSTHGFLAGDIYKAMGPSLLLSAPSDRPRDRFLVTSDIISLSLSADVVFLSACDTSGSDGSPDSEGFSGLTSAFLLAGARSVVATLWPVDKEATSSFVQSAMRNYRKEPNRPFTFSLQEAAVAFIKGSTSGRQHPAFWAPFVIVGG